MTTELAMMINELKTINKPIHTFCGYTGKYLESFNTYDEFCVAWPAAEIVSVEVDDEACYVYC